MARKPLTQQAVNKIRPDPSKTIEWPDHLYPQLRLIVQPTGARSFAVRARIAGKTAKLTLKQVGLDLAKARAATRDLLAEIAEGNDPRIAKRHAKAATLGGVAELYLKDTADQVRQKTRIERERHLRRDWAPLHVRPIAEIRKGETAARLLEIKDEHGAIAANRSRTTLHNLFEWAIDQDLVEANVVASTRRPLRKEPRRDRVLDEDERRAIWKATTSGGAYDAIVRLALILGQRKGEIGGMRWSEVDFDRALWLLPPERTKNGLPHLVPLPRQALEILQAQPHSGQYVFGQRGGAPFSGWSRCKRQLDKRCGVADWTIHDLRRSAVTGMNDLGIAPHVVEAVINHISGEAKRGVAGTYNRAQYLPERTRALQCWADHLTGASPPSVLEFPRKSSA
jgi:integrase